jgi:hypothetical protein
MLREGSRGGDAAGAGDEVCDAVEGATGVPVARVAIVQVHSPGDGEVEVDVCIAGNDAFEVEVPGDVGFEVGRRDVVVFEYLAADVDGGGAVGQCVCEEQGGMEGHGGGGDG